MMRLTKFLQITMAMPLHEPACALLMLLFGAPIEFGGRLWAASFCNAKHLAAV